MFASGRGPWEVWLPLRERWGRRATLVDLYELEAAGRGIPLKCLSKTDRSRLWAAVRPVRYPARKPAGTGVAISFCSAITWRPIPLAAISTRP